MGAIVARNTLALLRALLPGILLSMISTAVAWAEMRDNPFPGPAFSDPAVLTDMPADWQQRPLERAPAGVDVAIVLDQQIYPALLPFIEEYARREKLKIAVQNGTCGTALGGLSRKELDIGGYCCPPERADRLPGIKFHTIGVTGIALIVHPGNPVETLSRDEAQKIFSGQIRHWQQLDKARERKLPDQSVFVATRLHCKTRPGHWRLLLDNQERFSRDAQDVGSIPDMIRTVSLNRDSIGYETNWHVTRHAATTPVRTIKIDGESSLDSEAIATLRYPLYEVMNLTTWEGPAANPEADRLVAYLLSKAGAVGEVYGLVPVEKLRVAGWKFKGNELIGEPDRLPSSK
ncbi:MAG: substrate-binding domain-containing protein [Alphaproteobacteria bacterium]